MYIVTLYVEGGNLDGETFACGPFDTELEAAAEAASLSGFGSAEYYALEPNAEGIRRQIVKA